MRRLFLAMLLLLAAHGAPAVEGTVNDGASSLILTNVRVVDVHSGEVRENQTIVIEAARITGVGNEAEMATPAAAVRIDGEGRYVIPGLWDMHVHALWSNRHEAALPLFLSYGVTGIREMWGDLDVARSVRASGRPAPTIVMAGNLIDGPDPVWPGSNSVATAEEARALVRRLISEGAEFMKVYSRLPSDIYHSIAAEARAVGVPFAGHVPLSVTAIEASEAGQRSIEHLSGVLIDCTSDPDAIRANPPRSREAFESFRETLVATFDPDRCRSLARTLASNRTWQVPTLVSGTSASVDAATAFLASSEILTMHPEEYSWWAGAARRATTNPEEQERSRNHRLEVVRLLHGEGVPLLAGSDTFNPFAGFGISLHDELESLVEAGLSPLQSLRTATIAPATYLGAEDELGAIAPGMFADLVLLDGNPLEDIRNTRRIAAVVVRGDYLSSESLRELRERAFASHYRSALRMIDPFGGVPSLAIEPWDSVELSEDELRRFEGEYELEGNQVRVWFDDGRLHISTEESGLELKSVHLIPQGDGIFSRGLYENDRLRRIFWPREWLRLTATENGKRRIEVVPAVR